MSNWTLELQCFDIVRVWIRGEANILADAPSRAPWEAALAKHLPIPNQPIKELIRKMYNAPEEWEADVEVRKKELLGDEARWDPLAEPGAKVTRTSLTSPVVDGERTPEFVKGSESDAIMYPYCAD